MSGLRKDFLSWPRSHSLTRCRQFYGRQFVAAVQEKLRESELSLHDNWSTPYSRVTKDMHFKWPILLPLITSSSSFLLDYIGNKILLHYDPIKSHTSAKLKSFQDSLSHLVQHQEKSAILLPHFLHLHFKYVNFKSFSLRDKSFYGGLWDSFTRLVSFKAICF